MEGEVLHGVRDEEEEEVMREGGYTWAVGLLHVGWAEFNWVGLVHVGIKWAHKCYILIFFQITVLFFLGVLASLTKSKKI
jgi:heme/copper-type cytochrome/quinol oxidase subunit 3